MKKILIIGNGFDLNLGLKTSYSDFIQSDKFLSLTKNKKNYLTNRLYNNYNIKNWIDLEEELKKIAIEQSANKKTMLDFEIEYNELNLALSSYLKGLNLKKINKASLAYRLLEIICNNKEDYEIYSFNYTNLNDIIKNLDLGTKLRYTHVHGNLKDNSIILGFEDNVEIDDDYCYMIKTFSPHYKSSKIRFALEKAEEVIIFGHSLGSTDYHYFSTFFHDKSACNLSSKSSTKITIITADRKSRFEILKQLRKMNNKQTNILYDLNDFNIICCNEPSILNYNIALFLQRLDLEHLTEKALFQDKK